MKFQWLVICIIFWLGTSIAAPVPPFEITGSGSGYGVAPATPRVVYYIGDRVPEVGNKYYCGRGANAAIFCDDKAGTTGCIYPPKDVFTGKFVYATRTNKYSFTPMGDSTLTIP